MTELNRRTADLSASDGSWQWGPRRRAVILAATIGGLLVGGLGVAGALPGASSANPPVQTPTPNTNAGEHPNARGTSADHVPTSVPLSIPPATNGTPPSSPPEDTKGAEISAIARDPALQGLDKGAAVSDAASGGMSQAGDHGPPTSQATPPSQADAGLSHRPGP